MPTTPGQPDEEQTPEPDEEQTPEPDEEQTPEPDEPGEIYSASEEQLVAARLEALGYLE